VPVRVLVLVPVLVLVRVLVRVLVPPPASLWTLAPTPWA
jgi:hypothetical protein